MFFTSSHTWSPSLNWGVGADAVLAAWFKALVASWYRSLSCCTQSSVVTFVVVSSVVGMRGMFFPMRTLFGECPRVALVWLLCIVVARGSHQTQSSGWFDVIRHRYCLIHWFFHSVRPLVWGWKAVDRFWWVLRSCNRAFLKPEVKQVSLLLMICDGDPYHQ